MNSKIPKKQLEKKPMADFTKCTASELSYLYSTRSANPVMVAQQVLEKIQKLNPEINAFCFTDPETTLQQAHASEQRWRKGQALSAMDGVPVAIKDSILTQGWPTLHGSVSVDPNQSWSEDAPVTARLKEAGAVLVGKTNLSEFSNTAYHSNSTQHGIVRNPWNLKHSPGGSSGGSAVAVSAGIVPLAIGTDCGASIAVPSAFCGVFGMKPSFGRVPQYPGDSFNITTVGPLARSVKDLSMIMNVITKPDSRDWASLPYDGTDYTVEKPNHLQDLRVAYCSSMEIESVDTEIKTSTDRVKSWLSSMGAQVDLINLDLTIQQISDILYTFLALDNQKRWHTNKIKLDDLVPTFYHHMDQRKQLIRKMRDIMSTYDIILCPATVFSADQILVDDILSPNRKIKISPFSTLFSTSQQPSVTIPVGLNSRSMPVAVMIAGAMHSDMVVLQVAGAIQQQFPMPACPVIL